jgi:ABC-type nitrate/sulfonate/bicarbonate transport system ATPase subunit
MGTSGLSGAAAAGLATAAASVTPLPRVASLALLAASAPLAAVLSFFLSDRAGRMLSAGDAFAALWLLDTLRGALASAPAGARALVRLGCAGARLSAACAPRPQPPRSGDDDLAGAPPALRSALATRGALIMLAGPPGAGKSALCRAAAAAAAAAASDGFGAGALSGPPRFAFASSSPLILESASVRANVLFGAPWHAGRYAAALEASGLRRSVLPLLPAGDLSAPGDAHPSAPLPRGARQLIALARAAYARLPAAALDARLSELDAAAAAHVFAHVLGPCGALAHATRILVLDAGSTHLLAEADCAVLLRTLPAALLAAETSSVSDSDSFSENATSERVAAAGSHAELRANPALAALLAAGGSARSRDALEACTAVAGPPAGSAAVAALAPRLRAVRRSETWGGAPAAAASPRNDEAPRSARLLALPTTRKDLQPSLLARRLAAARGIAAALLCAAAQLLVGIATWRVVRHIDRRDAPLLPAVTFMSIATAIGAAGLAIGTRLGGIGAGSDAASSRGAMALAAGAGGAAAGLLAAIAPISLAATVPGAALLAATLLRGSWAQAAVARRAVSSGRGIAALTAALDASPDAAATVAAYGVSRRFGADLARLLDAHGGAEWRLAALAARAGVAADVAAAAALAAALFAHGPHGLGAAAVGWAVLQARWAGAAVRAAAALALEP